MLRIWYANEKTNSFRPTPWHWSTEPFPAWRGAGARYTAFQPVASGYVPRLDQPTVADGAAATQLVRDEAPGKIIHTAKGTSLLVPCPAAEDERIMLVTLRGGFRGWYSKIEAVRAEILFRREGNTHCCPTAHLVVRLLEPDGFLVAETGRRSGTGLVELFQWDRYQVIPAEEFKVWREILGMDEVSLDGAATP